MASGWASDDAVQQQIDSTIDDAVQRARKQLHAGASAEFCHECDEPIPEARRLALPGVQYCVKCQQLHDNKQGAALFNRRGSKDSQLR
ncbi:phage/conjugal plasmid C-4 type zinc finger TraR family protein [Erwinia toletana]|uniref:Phage/conjugal plasmid C-4 type zinc finger TraR family protein n=1 Tax=Winslowiella toletana TaxID=92490 RepID=A0ABS4PD18_9GAMM|nr:DksA/TraR family C4-type zinc finger protein [Winslowiella toletana]MBP2170524.1 phage/conjugal plasmid C-4 type zinc finger TraR family protein [Winslowiella toletana]